MPDNAAIGSSFELVFKANEIDKNRNTQAYVTQFYATPDDYKNPNKPITVGDMIIKYDGEW